MITSHQFRYLFAKPAISSRCLRRSFHPSKSLNARPKPKFPSRKAPKIDPGRKTTSENLPSYEESKRAVLAELFTPGQLEVIEAAEAAIDPKDLAKQAAFREDSMGLNYIDDLSKIHPVVDKPIRAPESNYDPKLRLKNEDEFVDDLANWARNLPKDPSEQDLEKFDNNLRLTVGKEEAELNPPSSLAPRIPKLYEPRQGAAEMDDKAEISPALRRLMIQSGYTSFEIRRFRVKLLVTRRVVNMTKLGKIPSLYFLTVAGNGQGMLGYGECKSSEGIQAQAQSALNAIKNMKPIPRYEERTIFGDVRGKVGGTELELMTRPPGMSLSRPHSCSAFDQSISGFGIRCQSIIYEMCKCAGISDLAARVSRSRNPMNTVKATMQALLSQQLPEDLARARGKKLVDVRRVYYHGNT